MPTLHAGRALLAALAFTAGGAHGPAPSDAAPRGSLAVWTGSAWETFWSARQAPVAWSGPHPAVARAVAWDRAGPGVETGELRLSGSGLAARLKVVLVRLDPAVLTFDLASATREAGLLGAWTVDSAGSSARVAFNAGQFDGGAPWGWHVVGGREVQPPGAGPLAMAFMLDSAGRARLLAGDEANAARTRGEAVVAFQSYPAVLMGDGEVPPQLRRRGAGVDVDHRDARLALGVQADGRILLALTRFDALGQAAGQMPLGPTTPEMAALMGALGSRRAVLLDGGLSAQLAVRGDDGSVRSWRGLRRVPLGMTARVRGDDPTD